MKKVFILFVILLFSLTSCSAKEAKLKDFNDYKWINAINENNLIKIEIEEIHNTYSYNASFHYETTDKNDLKENINVLNQNLKKEKKRSFMNYQLGKEMKIIYYTENEKYIINLEDGKIYFDNYQLNFNEVPVINNPNEEYIKFEKDEISIIDFDSYKKIGEVVHLKDKKFIRDKAFIIEGKVSYLLSNGYKIYGNNIIVIENKAYRLMDDELQIILKNKD